MPEPISSSNSSQSSNLGSDPTLDPAGQVCRSDAPSGSPPEPSSSQPPPAVSKLLSAVPAPVSTLPPLEAQNNAQRTSERSGVSGYAEYGITGGARDALFAGVAALKGRDPKTGIEVEVFSASAQVGGENEAQSALARMGLSGKHGSITAEFLTARGSGGAHNDDGSTGMNSGAVGTSAGVEATWNNGAESLTFGLAIGGGAAASFGLRDNDHDGKPELCAKVTTGPITLGSCAEFP